ncbi:MAG TPA: response regulator [Thermoanaerobaculia bacterium]|jgi:CheY-like chemotaxis protein|nr:response regulator [Thermoanaerobaculia bacterium]
MSKVHRILVIDDDADIRELISIVFTDLGYSVDTLADGIHALDLADAYDAILLDLNMPVFDGERLTDYWQLTDPKKLERLIVLTGYSQFTGGRQLPVFAMIRKPFEIQSLVNVVDACVRKANLAPE